MKVHAPHSVRTLCLFAGLALFSSSYGAWGGSLLGDVTISGEKGGEAVTTFAPDTPEIFMHADLTGVSSGSTFTCTWIAEDTNGAAPANFKISATDLKIGAIDNVADCSITKPNKGWPVGSYRVDLAVNGQTAKNAKFKVAPAQ